ncbi:filamin-binding LIM protein 1 [Melanotaenia boesemani]|uniref:filamin-binding LIM protein 1 n=1 Tax=Melanotaenia boesemani TaxID=1250792 RepID=UPI001C05A513|nr:filamin-binding LIM protein 1 [Melanotaenia boesemani]
MASAATPKRMVSSIFITLTSPQRATGTEQQPPLQAQHAIARDKQHTAQRLSSADNVPVHRNKKEDSYSYVNSKGWFHGGAPEESSDPPSPKLAQTEPTKAQLQKDKDKKRTGSPELLPPHLPSDGMPPSLGVLLSEESALPPPPPPGIPFLQSLSPLQQPVSSREMGTSTPSSWLNQEEQTRWFKKTSQDTCRESEDLCGFCRKPIAFSEPAIEALNRTYHDSCFQCRSCNISLAGKCFYNKAKIPFCEECYQASLELCWACGEIITDHLIRALERPYHPSCFTCTTCKRQIGELAFAQGDVGEIYCLPDYYRKYAPRCNACNQLIIPKEDGTDSYTVECLGRSYHENCYRCEVCGIEFSDEHSCYPLDGKLLCKSCHTNVVSEQ